MQLLKLKLNRQNTASESNDDPATASPALQSAASPALAANLIPVTIRLARADGVLVDLPNSTDDTSFALNARITPVKITRVKMSTISVL